MAHSLAERLGLRRCCAAVVLSLPNAPVIDTARSTCYHSAMKFSARLALLFFAILLANATIFAGAPQVLKQGDRFPIPGGSATLTRLDTLPLVENDYTKRFKFDSFSNPKLKELRERYTLDDVVAPGATEFDKQVLLMDWVHRQFKKFGAPSTGARGALDILDGIEQGHTFFCSHYAHVMVSAAASLGWVDRELALRRHQGVAKVGGSTEHSTTEIWSNHHRKWAMLDRTSTMYLEKDGLPLNAWEIRQEWFYHGGTNLTFIIGSKRAT